MSRFDLVFTNPPYSIGNEIINNAMRVTNKAIVLMPLSKYKKNNLYKKVKSYHLVNPNAFKDAVITENLSISILDNNYINDYTYDEFYLNNCEKDYLTFYKLNLKKSITFEWHTVNWINNKPNLDINLNLFFGVRVCMDGVHKTKNCYDYKFNVLNEPKIPNAQGFNIKFTSNKEKINFCKFWYKNPLMNKLLKGFHKANGSPLPAIPHIDWSKDRDYEHLTYDQLCDILRNEWM